MTKIEKLLKDIEENFYTIKQAAEIIGIKEQSLRNRISYGLIKTVKILNTTAISKEELAKEVVLKVKAQINKE